MGETGQEEGTVGYLLTPLKPLPSQQAALAAALNAGMHLFKGPAGTD